jgi:hypothetical protein
MKSHRIGFIVIIVFALAVSAASIIKLRSVAALSVPPSTDTSALVAAAGAADLGSTTIDTSVAAAPAEASVVATTTTTSVLSEFNKLSISGSCVVTKATNQKQCDMAVTYTSATGVPVVGIPVTIGTLDGEGAFTNVDGCALGGEPGGVGRAEQRELGKQSGSSSELCNFR